MINPVKIALKVLVILIMENVLFKPRIVKIIVFMVKNAIKNVVK